VIIVGRSPEKTAAVARALGVPYHVADFSRLGAVRALAAELLATYPRIDVLANNAGFIGTRRTLTDDGHEQMFQVNHLAPFLLTNLLRERLVASRARVITTSSVGNNFGQVSLGDLDHRRGYQSFLVYCATKLQNILFTKGLARRWGPEGVQAAAFHPGIVASRFGGTDRGLIGLIYRTPLTRWALVTPEGGADTLIWLATSRAGVDWQSGGYYSRRKPGRLNPQATDEALVRGLWEVSAGMVGVG
jgi:NAD(P)-dependent dehydrogenase (short-subunit alcohol dehydrogenase family)